MFSMKSLVLVLCLAEFGLFRAEPGLFLTVLGWIWFYFGLISFGFEAVEYGTRANTAGEDTIFTLIQPLKTA